MNINSVNLEPSALGSIALVGENPEAGKTTLDSKDFMKLLTTQLAMQDPLNPMKDTEFIAQMANFSSLETMNELSTAFETFTSAQQVTGAQNYLGKTVTVTDSNSSSGAITGPVTSIVVENGKPLLSINGKTYGTEAVTAIGEPMVLPAELASTNQ